MFIRIEGYIIGNPKFFAVGADTVSYREPWIVLPCMGMQRVPLTAALQADASLTRFDSIEVGRETCPAVSPDLFLKVLFHERAY